MILRTILILIAAGSIFASALLALFNNVKCPAGKPGYPNDGTIMYWIK